MEKKILILLLILCQQVLSMHSETVKNVNYYHLVQASSKELFKMGADYMIKKNKPDSSLICYSIITSRYAKDMDDISRNECCVAYNNIGYIYLYCYYDFSNALDNFLQAMEISEGTKTKASICLNIGNIYCYYAQYLNDKDSRKKALYYFKTAYYTAIKNHSWDTVLIAFDNLWNFGFDKNIIKENERELKVFKSLPLSDNYPMKKFSNYLYDAVRFIQNSDYDSAIKCFKKQFHVNVSKVTPNSYECQTYWNIIQIFKISNKHDSVYHYALVLLDKSRQYKMQDFEEEAYKILSDYYNSQGNLSKATEYKLLYYQARDALLNSHKLNNVNSQFLQHDLKKVTSEVKQLNDKRFMQNVITTIVLLIAAFILILLIIVYKKNKQLRFRNEVLYRKNLEILEAEKEGQKQRENLEQQLQGKEKSEVEQNKAEIRKKYQNTNLDENYKQELYLQIQEIMKNTDEICSNDFSLDHLSSLVDSKYKYVSQVINEKYGKSFVTLLSECRVMEACKRLNDIENYGNITIEGIAQSVGFKARSSFVMVFKRIIGMTPSEYQKMAKNNHNHRNMVQ